MPSEHHVSVLPIFALQLLMLIIQSHVFSIQEESHQ